VGFILGETRFFAAMRRLLQHPTFINDKIFDMMEV